MKKINKKEMKIVYAYVVGDILHKGHLLAIKNAKKLGDKLIVGVLTDEAVMEKKPRPIISFDERMELVAVLKYVNCVVPQEDYSPLNNVKIINPDILMESSSHKGYKYLEDIKKFFKGRIIMMPYYPDVSSTSIKQKIRK